jgi:hypothetical protein
MARQLSVHRKELLDVVKAGILKTQHSSSSDLSFHPHWHIIVSDGVFTPEGDFIPLWNWDAEALLEDLRTSILRAFVRSSKGGFRRYSWAELLALVWRVDPLECPKCGQRMELSPTMRGEELREFLNSINRLGYSPRPPPVQLAG